jgi:hypothetical protein
MVPTFRRNRPSAPGIERKRAGGGSPEDLPPAGDNTVRADAESQRSRPPEHLASGQVNLEHLPVRSSAYADVPSITGEVTSPAHTGTCQAWLSFATFAELIGEPDANRVFARS